MTRHKTLLSIFAIALAGATAASADCAADLAQLTGAGNGIVKDGSLAPLQSGDAGAPAATAPDPSAAAAPETTSETAPEDAEGIAKDGSVAPLGEQADVATSAQDAQAQSQGGVTAAADAEGASDAAGGSDRAAALERAQAALDQGDESACLAAVEEARAL